MDPARNCPYCGSTCPGDKCYNCSLKEEISSLTDYNADSIPFLDKIEEESKAYDESADKSAKTGTDSTAHISEDFLQNFLEGEDQYDSSPSPSVTTNILLSEINPPTPVNEESYSKETRDDLLKKNCASSQTLESAPEFISSPQVDASICSSKSSPTFSQRASPLDALPFEPLVSEDSNVWEEEKDKNVKSTDSSEKKDASSDAKVGNIVKDKNKQHIRETPSKNDHGRLSMSSSLESAKNQNEFENRPSCSYADPSVSDNSGHSRSKSKKIKYDHCRLSTSSSPTSTKNQNEFENRPSCSYADPSVSDSSGHSRSKSKKIKYDSCSLSTSSSPAGTKNQNEFENRPSCSYADPSGSDSSGHSRRKSKKSPLKHLPQKSFPCNECGMILSNKRNLDTHMFLHTKEKPFKCEECGNEFAQIKNLKTHMRRHTGDRPYVCNVCGRAFSYKNSLVVHIRTHTGEKPYICKTCGRPFAHKHSLNRHIRSHTK